MDSSPGCASLIPSLLLIPLLYALGCRISGTVAGLFAAFVATFSGPLILQAQVIRPYALELVLLAGALWFVFGEDEEMDRLRLGGYAALMTLAIFTQYSAVIAIAAVGGIQLLHRLRARRYGAAARWALLHVALAILAALLLWLLAYRLLDSDFRTQAVDDWLSVGFPRDHYFSHWLIGTFIQLVYFGDPPRFTPGIVLGIALVTGCFALYGTRHFKIVQMFLAASAINLVLAASRLYPFAGTRHALYLLPFIALIGGAGAQWLWDTLPGRIPRRRALSIGLFAMLTVAISLHFVRHELRRSVLGIAELPLLRANYTGTLEYIEATRRPDEILVGDKQLAYYAWLEGSMRDAERLSPMIGRTRLADRDFYYFDEARAIETPEDLARFLDELERLLGESAPRRLRLASLGWRSGLLYRLASPETAQPSTSLGDPPIRQALARAGTRVFQSGQLAGGGVVFVATWETLREGLRGANLSTNERDLEPDSE